MTTTLAVSANLSPSPEPTMTTSLTWSSTIAQMTTMTTLLATSTSTASSTPMVSASATSASAANISLANVTTTPHSTWQYPISRTFLLVHTDLMIVAWMICAPLGMFVSRNFKKTFNKYASGSTAWFKLHVILQVITMAATAASFVLMFVSIRTFAIFPMMPDYLHPFIGTIATGLCFANFLSGIGHANVQKRGHTKALHVIHFMLGNGALAAAITNILLGLLMQTMALPTWIIVFPIAFAVFHFGMNEMMIRHEVEQYQREIVTILYPKSGNSNTGSSSQLVDHSFSNPSDAFDNQIESTGSELGNGGATNAHRTTMKARLPYDAIRKRMFTAYFLVVIVLAVATLVSLHLTLHP